jgi:adenylate cyclase
MEVNADIKVGKVRRLAPLLLALVISAAAGSLFPFVQGVFSIRLAVAGAFLGCGVTLVLAVFETFFYAKRLQKLDMKWAILVKSVIYSVTISTFYFVMVLIHGQGELDQGRKIAFGSVFSFSVAASLIISSFVSISRILGQHELLRLIAGRYHTGKEEERIVMFIDMDGSTAIAERVGAVAFLNLLNDFIYDITGPILDSGGEIYKYVGDGVIVTWNVRAGTKKANCLMSFFVMQQEILKKRDLYLQKYQLVPEFRAGVHYGKVVIGEMGDFKREIAILGDTVNTAARIISECSSQNQKLLASSELLAILPPSVLQRFFRFAELGAIQLKGKRETVQLIAVDTRLDQPEETGSLLKWSFSLPTRQELRDRFTRKKPDSEQKRAA